MQQLCIHTYILLCNISHVIKVNKELIKNFYDIFSFLISLYIYRYMFNIIIVLYTLAWYMV